MRVSAGWREPAPVLTEPAADPVPRAPRGRGARRPMAAVASTLVVLASVAIFVTVYARARREESVVVIAQSVGAGTPVTAADVGSARVALGGSVTAIPYRDVSQVVGRWADASLAPGTLLVPSELSDRPGIPAGSAEVGVVLKPGQLPAAGLGTGAHVMVVDADAATGPGVPSPVSSGSTDLGGDGGAGGDGILVPWAVVVGTDPPPAAASSTAVEAVSLLVPSVDAPPVAVAAAAGNVVLVRVPGGEAAP